MPAQIKGPDKARWDELQKELKSFDALRPVPPAPVLTATDVGPVSPPTSIPGDASREAIEPGFPSVLDPSGARIEPSPRAPQSTGRQAGPGPLAEPARQPAFDPRDRQPDLAVPFRPGLGGHAQRLRPAGRAAQPSRAARLAGDGVRAAGWHLKPLHRLILTSAAYRQAAQRSSSELAVAERVDPENRLLWKRTVQRLDAEEIRDAMLAASGELEPIDRRPERVRLASPAHDRHPDRSATRRDALLDAFDAPDGNATTPRRNTTTTAPQALLLINGDWALARAEAFATRLEHARARLDRRPRPRSCWPTAWPSAAVPNPTRLRRPSRFLGRQARSTGAAPHRADAAADHAALVDFCHVLLEFK